MDDGGNLPDRRGASDGGRRARDDRDTQAVGRHEAVIRECIGNQEREEQRLEQMNFVEVRGHHCRGVRYFAAVLDNRVPSACGLWRITSNARQ